MTSLFVAVTYHALTQAAPIDPSAKPSEAATSCTQFRTISSIIWSCLFTLFACTWSAVHPNLPRPSDGKLSPLWRRMQLVLLAMIAPEYILFWALEQRRKAKRVAECAKKSGDNRLADWTLSHGFLAVMGGFVIEDENGKPLRAVVPGRPGMEFHCFDFPKITETQIQDRNKSDGFSRLIALLQLIWFLTGCIARGVKGLVVTELELVTAAYAILAVLIYLTWWHKPMGMTAYIPVTLKEGRKNAAFRLNGGSSVDYRRFLDSLIGDLDPSSISTSVPTLFNGGSFGDGDSFSVSFGQEYAVGILFGGVHCIGWKFMFLSRAEQLLWRISSTAITVYPAIGMVYFCYSWATGERTIKLPIFAMFPVWLITFVFGPPIYVIFRIILLVLPFVALRGLPESAFRTVLWSSFIPHIG